MFEYMFDFQIHSIATNLKHISLVSFCGPPWWPWPCGPPYVAPAASQLYARILQIFIEDDWLGERYSLPSWALLHRQKLEL